MTPSTIISECAREFYVEPSDVTGRRREPDVCDARHIAMWILYRVLHMTTGRVATYFKRDRSMVCHASQRVDDLSETDPRFRRAIKRIRDRLGVAVEDVGDVAGMTTG